ncbi:MAG: phosphopantetheine adenylyltransferase [Acidobacteriota bacterium]
MKTTASVLLALVGILHLVPVLGVLSAERLEGMYGVAIEGADMATLLRHRAILFGIAGGVMLLGALREQHRTVGFVAGFITTVSFVAVALLEGASGAEVRRVVVADGVGIGLLLVAAALDFAHSRRS